MLANASPEPEGPSGKRRLSSQERREAIVLAAVQLFSERGFRGTTTREIAAAVGVTEPILYQHFATKLDLYNAMVDWVIEKKQSQDSSDLERLKHCSDDQAFFHLLGMSMMKFIHSEPPALKLIIFSSLEGHELSEIWHRRITTEFRCFVEEYLRRRTGEGALRPIDPVLATRAFMGMVGHYGMMTSFVKGWEATQTPEQAVAGFVDIFLNGIKG
jgi:AcrR family transcriptional regulator